MIFSDLLYARAGIAYSYNTGEPMVKYTDEQIIDLIIEKYEQSEDLSFLPRLSKAGKGITRKFLNKSGGKAF